MRKSLLFLSVLGLSACNSGPTTSREESDAPSLNAAANSEQTDDGTMNLGDYGQGDTLASPAIEQAKYSPEGIVDRVDLNDGGGIRHRVWLYGDDGTMIVDLFDIDEARKLKSGQQASFACQDAGLVTVGTSEYQHSATEYEGCGLVSVASSTTSDTESQ